VEAAPDSRVAVIASGSFSLEIGGPRISEDSHTGVPDPAWVERVLELLRAADVATLVSEATDERLWRAGNAGGELLDWIAMLGMFDPRPPDFLDVQPQFGHAYVAWPLDPVGAAS
jgi:protocatechuate 4,5-dioxygenase beta chain